MTLTLTPTLTQSLTPARTLVTAFIISLLFTMIGCDALNPERPTRWEDITLYGNFLDVTQSPQDPTALIVQLRIGKPRALGSAMENEGRPTPTVEKGTVAEVTVYPDSVVLIDGRPASVQSINPGTEMVAMPVPGTTYMVGASKITLEAGYLIDFTTYRGWMLPGLKNVQGHPVETVIDDPALINTSGVEHAPVPLDGGKVLYFSARLRSPSAPDEPWLGAQRQGLTAPSDDQPRRERPYRSELTPDGWSSPEAIALPGTEEAEVVSLTWINEEETLCLMTVRNPGESSWVGRSSRATKAAAWGPVERAQELGTGYASDAVYLAGSTTMIAFVSSGVGLESGDLFLFNPNNPQPKDILLPLDPTINTTGDEWAPRVGPDNELLFCRGNNQLIRTKGGQVRSLRLPGPHRALISEANPTRNGKWVFLCMPKLTPVELDQDIWVAPLLEDWTLGEAVPVDQWRPTTDQ
jgi:hypothetical protein